MSWSPVLEVVIAPAPYAWLEVCLGSADDTFRCDGFTELFLLAQRRLLPVDVRRESV